MQKMNGLKFAVLILLVGATGCSNRGMYENLRIHQRQECLERPPSESIECLQRTNKSFEEYQREREEALKEGASSKKYQ
ncbi:hypothetical protein [Lacimicrobium alkaliphilum]|uniref:Lipoprotein n=1 Tax=Lacimicrobium alkaliphilum TaxID=1526571 RepID=A0ABQ1RPX5_9ALTE|nr:hypothetical protein [Lacimicrobium alkaliphilum]GGD73945.1 hypothetical protein GCM10011357_31230 [Lacimicrobium alkaliphilum]